MGKSTLNFRHGGGGGGGEINYRVEYEPPCLVLLVHVAALAAQGLHQRLPLGEGAGDRAVEAVVPGVRVLEVDHVRRQILLQLLRISLSVTKEV